MCYFFFKDNDEQDNITTALCALLHQLFTNQPQLIRHAVPAWEKTGDKLTKEAPGLWRTFLAATSDDEAHDVTCIRTRRMSTFRPTLADRHVGQILHPDIALFIINATGLIKISCHKSTI
jgi:hypothetical protein